MKLNAEWSDRHFLFLSNWPHIHVLKEQKSNIPLYFSMCITLSIQEQVSSSIFHKVCQRQRGEKKQQHKVEKEEYEMVEE